MAYQHDYNSSYNYYFTNYSGWCNDISDITGVIFSAYKTMLYLSVISNVAVLFSIISIRELHNTANVYICVICMCNILSLTCIWYSTEVKGPPVVWLCTHLFASITSTLTLVLLTFERWCAVVKPFWSNLIGVRGRVSSVVVLAACLITPVVIEEYYDNYKGIRDFYYVISYCRLFVMYTIPLLIICILNISVARVLCRPNRFTKDSVQHKRVHKKRVRSSCVVLGLVVNFAVCGFPVHVGNILSLYQSGSCF